MEVWVFLSLIVGLVLAVLYMRQGSSNYESTKSADPFAPSSRRIDASCDGDEELSRLRQDAQRILDERATDPVMVASQELSDFVEHHIDTLWAKKRQLSFVDDYGKENTSRFETELDYFIRNVVPERLIRTYAASTPVSFGDPVELAKGLVRQHLKWHNRKKSRELHEAKDIALTSEATHGSDYSPEMDGVDFEKLVKSKLEAQGFSVTETPFSGDQGVDLMLSSDDKSIAVQCKRSSSTIGNSAVQQVVAGKVHYEADEAWVVSDADFTPAARRLASTNEVKLVNFFTL